MKFWGVIAFLILRRLAGVMVKWLISSDFHTKSFDFLDSGWPGGVTASVTVTDVLVGGLSLQRSQGMMFPGQYAFCMVQSRRLELRFPVLNKLSEEIVDKLTYIWLIMRVYFASLCSSQMNSQSKRPVHSPKYLTLSTEARMLAKRRMGFPGLGLRSSWILAWSLLVQFLLDMRCKRGGLSMSYMYHDKFRQQLDFVWYLGVFSSQGYYLVLLLSDRYSGALAREMAGRARSCTVTCLFQPQNKHIFWGIEFWSPVM